MSGNTLIQQILALPEAPRVIKQLQVMMKEERQRRELFYNEITEQEKAEFINGEIIIHSPVTSYHNFVSINISSILNAYADKYDLGRVGMEKILIKLSRNDYEPDVCFFKQEKAKTLTKKQKLFPAPDLVVEVLSPSTAHRDRGIKFRDYQAHGIEEYWIVDTDAEIVEQYHLELNKYEELQYQLVGRFKKGQTLSAYVPKGLEIPINAVFNRNAALEIDRKTSREEGVTKGKEETIINGLKEGFSHEILAKLTGLSIENIKAIASKV